MIANARNKLNHAWPECSAPVLPAFESGQWTLAPGHVTVPPELAGAAAFSITRFAPHHQLSANPVEHPTLDPRSSIRVPVADPRTLDLTRPKQRHG